MILAVKDGIGNTRPDLNQGLYTHLDYLRVIVSLPVEGLEEFLNFIGYKYIGIKPEIPWSPGGTSVWYENTIISPEGIRGGYTIDDESNTVTLMVDFSGQYFSGKSVVDQWRLLTGLHYKWNADCSRIDIAIDDPSYSKIPLTELVEACNRGDNFRFRKYSVSGSGVCGQNLTYTHYFGSRESGKMVRIYDHDGECQRFEAEFKRGYSRVVFKILATFERGFHDCMYAIGIPNEVNVDDSINDSNSDCIHAIGAWFNLISEKEVFIEQESLVKCFKDSGGEFEIILQRLMSSIATSAIDVRDMSAAREGKKVGSKATERLDFYQKFIDLVGCEMRIRAPRKISTIEDTVQWFGRQVSKSLYVIKAGLAAAARQGLVGVTAFPDFLRDILMIGEEKMTLADEKKVIYIADNPMLVRI